MYWNMITQSAIMTIFKININMRCIEMEKYSDNINKCIDD